MCPRQERRTVRAGRSSGTGTSRTDFVKMAREITGGQSKVGRRPGGRTPFMLGREAVDAL